MVETQKNKKWFWLRLLVSVSAISFLIAYIGLDKILTMIVGCQPVYLIIFFFSMIAVIYFVAFEIWISLKILGVNLGHNTVIAAGMNSWAIGTITPARTGEISLIYFLNGRVAQSKVLGVLALSKVCTLLVLCTMALISLWPLNLDINPILCNGILFLVVILFIFCILTISGKGQVFLNIFAKYRPKEFITDQLSVFEEVFKKPRLYAWMFFSICCRWGVVFVLNYLLFKGANQNPSAITIIAATTVGRLISLLPISIGGLGIKEPVHIIIYSLDSILPEAVVAVSVLGMSCNYIISALIPFIAPVKKFEGKTI